MMLRYGATVWYSVLVYVMVCEGVLVNGDLKATWNQELLDITRCMVPRQPTYSALLLEAWVQGVTMRVVVVMVVMMVITVGIVAIKKGTSRRGGVDYMKWCVSRGCLK